MTRLQQAAYDAQLAASLPVSELARHLLAADDYGGGGSSSSSSRIDHRRCATYIQTVQQTEWFKAAFASHTAPVTVVGGRGVSHADASERRIKIGTRDRGDVAACELACLHELAHIVTSDHGPQGELRESAQGRLSSKGHHHAWRVNFVLIARHTWGRPAAFRLRREFNAWGLPTRK